MSRWRLFLGIALMLLPTLLWPAITDASLVQRSIDFTSPTLPPAAIAQEGPEFIEINGVALHYQRFNALMREATVAAHFVRQWGQPARVERLGPVLRYLWIFTQGTALLQFEPALDPRREVSAWWSWRPWPIAGAAAAAATRPPTNDEIAVSSWAPADSEWLMRYQSRQGAGREHLLMFRNSHGAPYNFQYVRQRCMSRGLRDIRREANGAVLHCASPDEILTATGQSTMVLRWRTKA